MTVGFKLPPNAIGVSKEVLLVAFKLGKILLGLALFTLVTLNITRMFGDVTPADGAPRPWSNDMLTSGNQNGLDSGEADRQQWPKEKPSASYKNRGAENVLKETQEDNTLQEKYLIPYMNARKSGMTHFDIAEKVFKVKLLRDRHHPHSYPLISGHTFSAFADVCYFKKRNRWIVKSKTGLPHELKNGDIIFTRTRDVGLFGHEILPKLPQNVSFILVTSCADVSAPAGGPFILKDHRLIRWFTLNPSISHPKMEAIPLGLRNYVLSFGGRPEYLAPMILNTTHIYSPDSSPGVRQIPVYVNFTVSQRKSRQRALAALKGIGETLENSRHHRLSLHDYLGSITSKTSHIYSPDSNSGSRSNLVYVNFDVTHHASRKRALATLKDIGEVHIPHKYENRLSLSDYFGWIARSKFMASPRGNAIDCYRTWEAIAMGAIVIVENSTLNPLHEQAPAVIVNDWDASVITKEYLLKQRVRVRSRRVLLADYWFEKINRVKEEFLRGNK